MAKINVKDVVAYTISNKTYCPQCVKDEGVEEISLKEVLLRKDFEAEDNLETLLFCDICRKQIE